MIYSHNHWRSAGVELLLGLIPDSNSLNSMESRAEQNLPTNCDASWCNDKTNYMTNMAAIPMETLRAKNKCAD